MLRSILLALDGSPYSDAATTLALEWATKFDAGLVAVGVLDKEGITKPQALPIGASAYKKERDEALLADADARVRRVLADV